MTEAAPPPGPARAARTVLLVEDDADDVALIRRAFRKAGLAHLLQVIGDGDDAVDFLGRTGRWAERGAQVQPAFVLLDWKLPRRNGLEVLRWIRAQAFLLGLPVVVLTSSQEPEDLEAAYSAGANSYLLKPVRFEELVAIARALDAYWLELNRTPERH